jgi:hypothetical protein
MPYAVQNLVETVPRYLQNDMAALNDAKLKQGLRSFERKHMSWTFAERWGGGKLEQNAANMNRLSIQCNATADNQFGPVVPCIDFDFSLAFEQTIFTIGASACFLLLFPFRLKQLHGSSIKLLATPLRHIKAVSFEDKA